MPAPWLGRDSVVQVGTNDVALVREASFSETTDAIEINTLNATATNFVGSKVQGSFEMTCYFDDTDGTGQALFQVGSTVSNVQLHAGPSAGGGGAWSGNVVVTDRTNSVSADGVVEVSISGRIDGAVTQP